MQFSLLSSATMMLRPSGHLDANYGLELEHRLAILVVNHSNRNLVLNLEAVESIDSAGLMTLVSAFRLAQRHNLALQLYAVPPSLKIVLELSQLDRVFSIHDALHEEPVAVALPIAA
ncbi:MAG: STAS domain-containing protein [Synechococcales cyanobacterium CRU_2_2]|nr:STAS domain-containing protein [Synechococcales cyanobacterium CRU_2_2]